ncbi:MAG: hypothetical protein HY720_29220 [Planctomycetes bacterium]|nr:hypothetical protein [Planctomycetota bacterium]
MRLTLVVTLLMALAAPFAWGQFESDSAHPRWGLSIDILGVRPDGTGGFDHVTLTDPLGRKTTYWYVAYRISNRTNEVSEQTKNFFRDLDKTEEFGQPIDVRVSTYLIVDVPEGVRNKEKLQNLFRTCELPNDLRTRTMNDMVAAERAETSTPTEEYRKHSSEDVYALEKRKHEENAQVWNHFHQVRREEDTYFYSRSQWLSWFQHYREGHFPEAKAQLEALWGKKLLDGSEFTKLLDTPKPERPGLTPEIKYEPIQLKPGESVDCVAIFPDISPEADYIGVMFEGLVDPIVREDDWMEADGFAERTYVERTALLACFARLGDEFKRDQDTLRYLGKKPVVTERYPVDYGLKEYNSDDAETVPPNSWSKAADTDPQAPPPSKDDPDSLRKRNEDLVGD